VQKLQPFKRGNCTSAGWPEPTPSDWIGLSSVLRPRQHSIGYMGDGFTGQKTQPTVSKY